MKRNEIYNAVVTEIERIGGRIDKRRFGNGSHRVVYWSLDGRRFHNTIQAYTGNWRSRHNAIADIRAKARGVKK